MILEPALGFGAGAVGGAFLAAVAAGGDLQAVVKQQEGENRAGRYDKTDRQNKHARSESRGLKGDAFR